jgi:hypothetical protein
MPGWRQKKQTKTNENKSNGREPNLNARRNNRSQGGSRRCFWDQARR